ncbi:Spo0E family sporulation regulatory protein-aspartic acid phosphatase [Proteiniborus sp. MB09-C3]|uniref:Spo0E family sporulation regulatory protein-aspartic acid phosphatase n=1 Tax=Proteiniborus sp. MB09-C3 TaxID=3050072 RepID=UPI002556AD51|nr:Spo0E family sporulation regulatory protein-aspartic acid phosphatase [Proteiniborus sp. MB09-C3]WIV11250.1 Spo0E family sporulation regulatory protein-aspartic acid phosphatase [Proteiniborus sp. MB09-C3]
MKIIDEITNMRDKLNKSIMEDRDYEQIYRLSTQLDDLIVLFYQTETNERKKIKVS